MRSSGSMLAHRADRATGAPKTEQLDLRGVPTCPTITRLSQSLEHERERFSFPRRAHSYASTNGSSTELLKKLP